MSFIFGTVAFFAELVTLILFCLISAYVFCLGKKGTGINMDYAFFAFVCMVVFLIL